MKVGSLKTCPGFLRYTHHIPFLGGSPPYSRLKSCSGSNRPLVWTNPPENQSLVASGFAFRVAAFKEFKAQSPTCSQLRLASCPPASFSAFCGPEKSGGEGAASARKVVRV